MLHDLLDWLLKTDGFPLRYSGLAWSSFLAYAIDVSDVLISLSCFFTAFVFWVFIRQRHLPEFRCLFASFTLFLIACGLSRAVAVVCAFWPVYRLFGCTLIVCALVGVITSLFLVKATPKAMAIPHIAVVADLLLKLRMQISAFRQEIIRLSAKDPALAEEKTRRAIDQMRKIVDRASDI